MPATPFDDPYDFVALPRVSGLVLSPDGSRLVAPVTALATDRKRWVSALWEVDPAGAGEPRRLTGSAAGESAPAFLPDGSLLFLSARPDPEATGDSGEGGTGSPAQGDDVSALWLLPGGPGEAGCVATRPGGIEAVAVARDSGATAFSSPVMPGAAEAGEDARLRAARRDAGVTALLHEGFPIRSWDRDLGPEQSRLFVLPEGAAAGSVAPEAAGSGARDLTPDPGRALDDPQVDMTPDGRFLLAGWAVWPGGGHARRSEIVAIDTATGERRTLAADPAYTYAHPVASPDGRYVVCERERLGSETEPPDITLWLVALDGTPGRDVTPELDLWPAEFVFAPDSAAVYFVADEDGRRPAFRLDLDTGEIARLTGDRGAYRALCPSPDGAWLYALRGSVDEPPAPVRLDPGLAAQFPFRLRGPGAPVELPGSLAEVGATSEDGQPLRAWLVTPGDAGPASPAPLLLWIHGGPHTSWNDWHWRWNPWVAAARGYAVLLPDPALSTGYGLDFVRRGWGAWGSRPYTDLMAITDAAEKRTDIDETRTAAMGGSFGGYMANWIAGHTDRFRAVVTHASLWALDQMMMTSDAAASMLRDFGDPHGPAGQRIAGQSPHHHASAIRTPMLVIHGANDYRVPVGEALRLWWDLVRNEVDAKFLYFPDENHWVLKPGEAALWYETIFAFLDHHVRGEPWCRPALL